MTQFNDYEYGWYGFHGVFSSKFFDGGSYHYFENTIPNNIQKKYVVTRNNTLKQLKSIQNVKFTSGSYKDVI